ncbi:MAG TPA: bifunctional 4-hydroxy-2-oxoglutarate aldolase/2-dehydro-3-deoxy-phosphogluconate aldolase [Kofleriaceae bacterium]|nr:bifunctional 4-hydroxy-2-oxoglutarate aldolase/2-dehydro-3-deoxy-phosphogluconate aldolase [Kofleriaceae bacterium]
MSDAIVRALWRERATAILRTDDQARAAAAMEAAVRGGFRALEFTLTTPGALELIADFARRPDLLVGAGTVMTAALARDAVRAGARFLVSPVVDEEVIGAARDLGVAAMPGAHTPTEMWRAHRAGAPLVKLFPAPAGGPAALRAILGPMPFLRVVPTNGVDADNAGAWLAAGAHSLGFVRSLFEPDALAAGDLVRIEERARRILRQVAGFGRPEAPPESRSPVFPGA